MFKPSRNYKVANLYFMFAPKDMTLPNIIKIVVVTWSAFPATSATSNIVTFTVCHTSRFISEKLSLH